MNVGDYERTNYGTIAKIEEIYEEYIVCDKGYVDKEDIIKSSPNIIDLIEVGDYVNGYYVEDIRRRYDDGIIVMLECATGSNYFQAPMYNEDIKSIVTHEQFESMQYNLESEVN